MIDVAFAVRDRIIERCHTLFANVGMIADSARVADITKATPAAYVIPMSEQAGPARDLGASVQLHELAVGVFYIVRQAGDASGERSADAITVLRDAVADALVGWVPECGAAGSIAPMQFASGSFAGLDDGITSWQDDFTTRRYVQRGVH